MARQGNDLPIREHLRRRGVKPQPGGGEKPMESQPVVDSAGPAPNFGELLFGNTDISHEDKLKIMEMFDASDVNDADSLVALHDQIYNKAGALLPSELKDKLASLRTYSPEINRNRNPVGRARVPQVEGITNTLDPSTGQAWAKNIGPNMRAKILAKAQAERDASTSGEVSQPGGSMPGEITNFPAEAPSGRQPGRGVPYPAPAPVGPPSGPIRYEPPSGGKPYQPAPGMGHPGQKPPMAGPSSLPPELLMFLRAFGQQGGM